MSSSGHLFIVSAPSGAGKTSLVRALLAADAKVKLSISYTTRAPRPGEINGSDYHFVPKTEFERMAERGEFLESALVHGNRYGTSQSWISSQTAAGHDILLEIDWQGAAQVRRLMPEAIGIFILPPSLASLEARLTGRALDSAEVIAARLAAAREEISHAAEFDYVIINDKFDEALADVCCVIRAVRLKAPAQLARYSNAFN